MKRIKMLVGIMMFIGFLLILSGASKMDISMTDITHAEKLVLSGSILLLFGICLRLYFDRYIVRKRRNAIRVLKVSYNKQKATQQTHAIEHNRRKNFAIPEIV